MTPLWVARTPTGGEFDAMTEAKALGLYAVVPRRVDMIRRATQSRAEPVTSAYLPGYAFVAATFDQWHDLRRAKHIRGLMIVPHGARASVETFIDRVESTFEAREAAINAAMKTAHDKTAPKEARRNAFAQICPYTPGDMLEVISGPFLGLLASFQRVTDAAHPEVVAEVQIFGGTVQARLGAGDVRKMAG